MSDKLIYCVSFFFTKILSYGLSQLYPLKNLQQKNESYTLRGLNLTTQANTVPFITSLGNQMGTPCLNRSMESAVVILYCFVVTDQNTPSYLHDQRVRTSAGQAGSHLTSGKKKGHIMWHYQEFILMGTKPCCTYSKVHHHCDTVWYFTRSQSES